MQKCNILCMSPCRRGGSTHCRSTQYRPDSHHMQYTTVVQIANQSAQTFDVVGARLKPSVTAIFLVSLCVHSAAHRVIAGTAMSVVKTVKDRQERRALLEALNQEPKKRSLWWEHKERILQEWLTQSPGDLAIEVCSLPHLFVAPLHTARSPFAGISLCLSASIISQNAVRGLTSPDVLDCGAFILSCRALLS
jgi:hypothetical protein